MDIFAITTQEVLDRVSRHCPEALSAYLHCINRADQEGQVYFPKSMVDIDMSEDWHKFRNNIKKLARENLVEWHPFDQGISVTLVDLNAHE